MKKLLLFLLVYLFALSNVSAQFTREITVASTEAKVNLIETDQTLAEGLYRIRLSSNIFSIEKNTALARDYSTFITIFSSSSSGNIVFPGSVTAVSFVGSGAGLTNLNGSNIDSGVVGIPFGGTGATTASTAFNNLSPMTTLGDTIYGGASGVGTRLPGNITTTRLVLTQTGTGTVSAAPVWGSLTLADITGILGVAKGGTGVTTLTLNGVLYGNGINPVLTTAQAPANSVLAGNVGAPFFTSDPTVTTLTTTSTFTAGGQFRAITGSATIPSYSFTLDTDTGIYSGGSNSNILYITTGGVIRAQYNVSPTDGVSGNFGFGINASGQSQFTIGGTWPGSTFVRGINFVSTLSSANNNSQTGIYTKPTFTEGGTSPHTLLATLEMDIPVVTAGGATVTNTAQIYVSGPMTAVVTGANYSIWVNTGTTKLADMLATTGSFSGAVTLSGGLNTPLAVAQGGTASSTAQTAINTLSNVAGATNEHILTKDTATGNAIFKAAPGGGAPSSATYITQTADAGLSAEQALGVLATGILKSTTTTGVLSIAVAGDFPTLNQNTTGTAGGLTGTPSISIGNLTIGGGTPIVKVMSATGVLDFASLSPNTQEDLTITVSGAAIGDPVSLAHGAPNGSIVLQSWVSAADTVTVRASNTSSVGAHDQASFTYRVVVFRF